MNLKKYIISPYIFWSLVFTIVPLILIFYFAFNDGSGNFTLNNILKSFSYFRVFVRSTYLGIISTAICFIIAYPVAYFMSKCSRKCQNILKVLIMLPMWVNILLRTYAWLTILEYNGILNKTLLFFNLPRSNLINTDISIILGMVYNFIPYMILPLHSSISKIDKKIFEAARDLGASKKKIFFKILLPLSTPGIISSITIVFVPSVSTFVISSILGGSKNILIGDLIEMQFLGTSYNPYFGSALSLILMFLVFIFTFLINSLETKSKGSNALVLLKSNRQSKRSI